MTGQVPVADVFELYGIACIALVLFLVLVAAFSRRHT